MPGGPAGEAEEVDDDEEEEEEEDRPGPLLSQTELSMFGLAPVVSETGERRLLKFWLVGLGAEWACTSAAGFVGVVVSSSCKWDDVCS